MNLRKAPPRKRPYGEEAGNDDQPSSPRKGSNAKKNKEGRAAAIKKEKKQAEAIRETENRQEAEPKGDPMFVDSEVPPSEQQGSASPNVPPPCQASHSHESGDESRAQDSDDEGAEMADDLSGDAAGDDAAYDRESVLNSFVKALYANSATEEDVTNIMGALPSTVPTPTQISAILIAGYTAFWTVFGGLGVPSLVWAMVGLVPLVAGVLHYTQVVYCMHFPVDKDHMMGAGKETRWGFKNMIGRFVGHDGKPVQTGCCTGYYLLLLQQYLPFQYVPIIDLYPFVNRARGGGFTPGNPLHVAALSKTINMWLANLVRIWRIGSRTGVLGALSVLEGLKAEGCKHFDVKVHVGRQKILMFCLLNVRLSTSKLQNLYRSVKNSGLSGEQQHQQFELLLSEMEPADRAEVEALERNEGKTLLEAYNSWHSRTTATAPLKLDPVHKPEMQKAVEQAAAKLGIEDVTLVPHGSVHYAKTRPKAKYQDVTTSEGKAAGGAKIRDTSAAVRVAHANGKDPVAEGIVPSQAALDKVYNYNKRGSAKKSRAEARVKELGGVNAEVFDADGTRLGKIFDGILIPEGKRAYKVSVVEGIRTIVCNVDDLRRADELDTPTVVSA